MDEKKASGLAGQALGPLQGVRAAGVGGMAEQGRSEQGVFSLPGREKTCGLCDVFFRVRYARSRKIDDPLGSHRPHPRLAKGSCRRILMEIGVRHSGGATQDHLCGGKLAAPIDHLRIHQPCLAREDVLREPGHERQVIRQPPEEGHGAMAVAVDQPRHDQVARCINDPLRQGWGWLGQVGHGADSGNGPVPHGKVGRLLHPAVGRIRQKRGIGYEQVMGRHKEKSWQWSWRWGGRDEGGGDKGGCASVSTRESGYGIR